MRMQFGTILAATLALGAFADAGVLWVDKANGVDSAGRGSESSPYGTIQAAVNAASSGDTIKVKPGVYDEGSGNYNGWNNRVLISGKVLKIVSTGGKDVTHITGSGTMRCVCFHDAAGSVVEGFTIRDGAATYAEGDAVNGRGGGVLGITADKQYSKAQACVVDCVVSNCVGVRGGAFASATAVRCWITENTASNSGGAGRMVDFVNCLITRNVGTEAVIYENCKVVNCTIVDNDRHVRSSISLCNSVVLNNSNSSGDERSVHESSLDHCVTRIVGYDANLSGNTASVTNASPLQFVAPLYDDFRVVEGSVAETAGEASLIDSAGVTVPADVDLHKDLFGNAIPGSGTIAAGCIQTVVEPQGGAILFSGRNNVLTRGKVNYGKYLYAFAETYPTQFMVQAVNKGNPAIFSFQMQGAGIGSANEYVYPTMDDTAYFTPPSAQGAVYTNSVNAAVYTYYVDPNAGSDSTADGKNPATPYKTIQAALNDCKINKCVVRAAEGDYNEGGTTAGGLKTRVHMSTNSVNIRLIGAGADKSVIWGEADPSTGGMGLGGTRCVFSGARGCIQGFTLRDGYANGSSSGDNAHQRGGGVCYNVNSSYNSSLHVADCIITNCWAYRGGAGYSGAYERCHITDCHGDGGVMRYAKLVSCVVDDLEGVNNMLGKAYNTTFVGLGTDKYIVHPTDGTYFTNCIVVTTKKLTKWYDSAGSIAWDVSEFAAGSGFTLIDPMLADVAGGDYRPLYNDRSKVGRADDWSPALGNGVWFELPGFSVTDFDGRPLNLVAGRPAVGAYQWPFVVVVPPGLYLFFK